MVRYLHGYSRAAGRPRPCLRTARSADRLILDNAHDSFVAMSADGLIAEWNRQAEITFGWREPRRSSAPVRNHHPSAVREAHSRGLARFLATGEGPVLNRVIEVPALRRDGREFPAEISIAPVRLGEQYLFVAFIRDVTERKRAERGAAAGERGGGRACPAGPNWAATWELP